MKTSLILAVAASSAMAIAALPAFAQMGGSSQVPSSVVAPVGPSTMPAGRAPAAVTGATPTSDPSGRPRETVVESVPTKGEPNVQHTIIEDKGSRIDELKVRGQTKRITVTPKQGVRLQYEILSDDGTGMGDSAASQTPHGNEGRRVWNVLSF